MAYENNWFIFSHWTAQYKIVQISIFYTSELNISAWTDFLEIRASVNVYKSNSDSKKIVFFTNYM